MAVPATKVDEEQVQLATSVDHQQKGIVGDDNNEEIEIKQKSKHSPCPSQKIIIILVILLIVLCGIAVLIWYLTTLDESHETHDYDINNIQDWSYNVILSKNIDSTGLEHGIIYKQLNLSVTDTGINRINFNQYYEYNGPIGNSQTWLNAQSRTIFSYALAYQHIADERFLKYAINGINAIFRYFHDNVYDGYYRSIILYDNGTRIIDNPTKDVAQHQFLIKALSKLYQVTLNETYLNEAINIYNILCTDFTDSTGVGLYGTLSRDFENVTSSGKGTGIMVGFFQSVFDLYEAYQIYYDENDNVNETILVLMEHKINEIYEFIMDLRVNVTILNEQNQLQTYSVFCLNNNEKWEPESSMLIIDNILVADSFKFSLYIWKYMNLNVIAKTNENILKANQLFHYSMDLSFNDETGSLGFKYYNTTLTWYWWHSTQWWMGIEAIRTVVYYHYIVNDQKYDKQQVKALTWYNNTFYDPEYGGLYSSASDYSKGHEWKVGYHTIESTFDILDSLQFHFN